MTPIAGCSQVLVDVLEWYAHSMVLESSDESNIQYAAEQIVHLLSILGLKTDPEVSSKSHGSSLSLSLPLLDSSNSLLLEDHVLNRLRLSTLVHSICGRERWGKDQNVLEQIQPLDWQQMKLMLEDCRKHMKPSKDSCNNNQQYIDIAYRDVMNLLECHTILADFLHSEGNDNQNDIHQVSIRLNNLKTRLRKLTFSTLGTKTPTTKVTAPMAIVEFLRQDILSSPKRYINVYQKAQDHVQSLIHTIGQPYSYDTLQCKVQTLARIWSESMLGIPTLIHLQYGGLSTETFDPMTLVGPIVATDDTKSISSWGMDDDDDDDDDDCTDEEMNTKVVNNRSRKTIQKRKQRKSEKPRIITTRIPPINTKKLKVRPVVASDKQQLSRYKNSNVKNHNNDDDDDATVLEEENTAVAKMTTIPPMQIRPREHWKESFEIMDGLNESDIEVALMEDKRTRLTNVHHTTPQSTKQSTKTTSRHSLATSTNYRKSLPGKQKQEKVVTNLTSEAIFMKLIQSREQQQQEKQQGKQQQQEKQHKNIQVDQSNRRPNKTLTGTKRHGNEAPMEPKSLHRLSPVDATKKMKEKVKPMEAPVKTILASTLGVDVASPTKSVKLQSKERIHSIEQPQQSHQVYTSSISDKTIGTTQDPLSKTIPTITNAIRASIPTMTTIPTTSSVISKKSIAVHKRSHASKFLIPKSDSIRRFRRRFFHEIVD
jgi:hypothetical protein